MINVDQFINQKFSSHGIVESFTDGKIFRIPADASFPANDHLVVRKLIRDLIWTKADAYRQALPGRISDYGVVEKCCRIPTDTVKKTINGTCNITRRFLAKFCVGLKFEISEANELFRLYSGELNLSNDFDFIVYHALDSKDEIDFFIQEVDHYLHINLDRDRA